MRLIYHSANIVRVWFGEAYHDSSSAFEMFREVCALDVLEKSYIPFSAPVWTATNLKETGYSTVFDKVNVFVACVDTQETMLS
jgi:hypothetical protein